MANLTEARVTGRVMCRFDQCSHCGTEEPLRTMWRFDNDEIEVQLCKECSVQIASCLAADSVEQQKFRETLTVLTETYWVLAGKRIGSTAFYEHYTQDRHRH